MPMTGGGGIGTLLGDFLVSAALLMVVWEGVVCMFPLTAIAAFAAASISVPIATRMLPSVFAPYGIVVAMMVGWIAAGFMSRLEYRLAQNRVFRLSRHVVRMMLLSVLAIPLMMLAMGANSFGSINAFIFNVISRPAVMARFLFKPIAFAIWCVVMIAVHFAIWNWGWARRFWHRRLVMVGLK